MMESTFSSLIWYVDLVCVVSLYDLLSRHPAPPTRSIAHRTLPSHSPQSRHSHLWDPLRYPNSFPNPPCSEVPHYPQVFPKRLSFRAAGRPSCRGFQLTFRSKLAPPQPLRMNCLMCPTSLAYLASSMWCREWPLSEKRRKKRRLD